MKGKPNRPRPPSAQTRPRQTRAVEPPPDVWYHLLHYGGGERLSLAAMRALAVPWQPYRSVATWYLWRSLDPVPVEY